MTLSAHKKKKILERSSIFSFPSNISDQASVARSMMSAVESQGKRMFSSEELLTPSQVDGFFSRLAAKKSLFSDDDLIAYV